MGNELNDYVRGQLSNGRPVQVLIEELKANGWTEEQINQSFQEVMSSQFIAPVPTPENNIQIEDQKPKKKFDATKAFLIIGSILIAAAVIIVIYSQWSSVGPAGRIGFLGVPMAMLFIVSYMLSKSENFKEYADWPLGIGYFIVPFFIGTFLYQTAMVTEIDQNLFLATAILTLPIYLTTEFVFKRYYLSVFSLVAIYTLFLSIFYEFKLEYVPIVWLTSLVSLLIAMFGFWLTYLNSENCKAYLNFGTLTTLFLLPVATLASVNELSSISYESNLVIVSVFGIVYLFVASFYSVIRQYFKNDAHYLLKRLIEEVAPFVIIIPWIILGFSEREYAVVALILSALAILSSIKVRISSLLFIGSFGLILSVLTVSSAFFIDSIGWPILVFIAGFIAIGIGLSIRKIIGIHKENEVEPMVLGLGKDPNEIGYNKLGVGKIIGIIIISILVLPGLYFGLIMHQSSNYESPYERTESIPRSNYKTIEEKQIPYSSGVSATSDSLESNYYIEGEQ